jgi:ureidoglycolate lyase
MPALQTQDLTAEAFAPYGEVFAPAAVSERADHVATLQNGRDWAKPNLFMARSTAVALPFDFDRMERHPHSSQSFVPMGDRPMLVAAALPGADGRPDPATLKAFLGRNLGFSYRAGIWHLPVASLGEGVPFVAFMYEDGTPEDCVWAEVGSFTISR